MKIGKIPPDFLERLLGSVEITDDRVLLGPKVGEDAALLDYGDRVLVAKTDPITFASDLIGWYAVQITANDVACCGATPRWFMASVLVPETLDEAGIEGIFNQLIEACAALGVTLIGGHTEITRELVRPVVVGCMLGEAEKGKTVLTGTAQEGDSIVVTKGVAIEGTSLLAGEAPDRLLSAGVDEAVISAAKELLFSPGISVVKDALTACSSVDVHSMHDPTEGGLATGLWEVAGASGLGLAVELGSIPILTQCSEICDALGLDPVGLLASGALLVTLAPENVPALTSALEGEGIDAYEIGRMMDRDEGVSIIRGHELEPLPKFDRDELARFLSP